MCACGYLLKSHRKLCDRGGAGCICMEEFCVARWIAEAAKFGKSNSSGSLDLVSVHNYMCSVDLCKDYSNAIDRDQGRIINFFPMPYHRYAR